MLLIGGICRIAMNGSCLYCFSGTGGCAIARHRAHFN